MNGDTVTNASGTGSAPWYQSLLDNISKLGTSYLSIEQQRQLDQINVQRAQQGLAPIDTSQYQTGVNVGVSASTQQTVLIVVAVLAGAWILSSFIGKKR